MPSRLLVPTATMNRIAACCHPAIARWLGVRLDGRLVVRLVVRLVARLVAAGLLGAMPWLAYPACVDEDKPDLPAAAAATVDLPPAPRALLQALVHDALARNKGLGAARLLAQAAQQDVAEARAAKRPQAALIASISPGLSRGTGLEANGSQVQARAGLTLTQTVFDGGRADRVIDWRGQQAEAARLGLVSTQEQIALSTTSLALERSRFRMQAVIWGQHVRKMACLVEALDTLVAADRGRASELVQARKQQQQAELQQQQSTSQARQVEARLRRVVGDGLPGTEGMAALLLAVPDLPELLAAAERAADIAQLDANAAALGAMARAVEAGNRPQLSWTVGANSLLAAGGASPRSAGLSAGVTVSVPLLNPAIQHSTQAARQRAEAATLQRADQLELRRQRIVESHEQAGAAFDRLRRVSLVLRDSDRLRNFTLQQWQQLGRRSLFDVIAAESDHYNLRVQYVNALHDGQQMNATLTSLGPGLTAWLQ